MSRYHVSRIRKTLRAAALLGAAWCLTAPAHAQAAAPETPAADARAAANAHTDPSQPIVLDRVIAIINGDVLLESDVQEEMVLAAIQPISIQQGQNTPRRAGDRLINRTLILQQMKEQPSITRVTDAEVRKSLDDLRKQIPACARYHCTTQQGWLAFLKDNGLTEQQVEDRWKQRQEILHFIDVRFRAGIRISKADIQEYYDKTLIKAFQKENVKPPPVDSVASRIEEILLQQKVSLLLQDWLKSLRDQGSVQILDSAYGQSSGDHDDDEGGSE